MKSLVFVCRDKLFDTQIKMLNKVIRTKNLETRERSG